MVDLDSVIEDISATGRRVQSYLHYGDAAEQQDLHALLASEVKYCTEKLELLAPQNHDSAKLEPHLSPDAYTTLQDQLNALNQQLLDIGERPSTDDETAIQSPIQSEGSQTALTRPTIGNKLVAAATGHIAPKSNAEEATLVRRKQVLKGIAKKLVRFCKNSKEIKALAILWMNIEGLRQCATEAAELRFRGLSDSE